MLDILLYAPSMTRLAALATALLALAAALARLRKRAISEHWVLLLLTLPLAATADALRVGILKTEVLTKIDARFISLIQAHAAISLCGAGLLVCGALAALAPELRRGALSVLPGAAGLTGWSWYQLDRIQTMALRPAESKLALWVSGEPLDSGLAVLTLVLAAVAAAWTRHPRGTLIAVSAALPLLAWPEHLIWEILGNL